MHINLHTTHNRSDEGITLETSAFLLGKVSAQPHTIVKQICFPDGNVLFSSLFSLFKNWMHNVLWGCTEILPFTLYGGQFMFSTQLLTLNYLLVFDKWKQRRSATNTNSDVIPSTIKSVSTKLTTFRNKLHKKWRRESTRWSLIQTLIRPTCRWPIHGKPCMWLVRYIRYGNGTNGPITEPLWIGAGLGLLINWFQEMQSKVE